MRNFSVTLAAFAAFLGGFGASFAQDAGMEGMAAMELPAVCQTGEAPAMAGMDTMQSGMEGMTEAQRAAMQGMMATHGPMMQGLMAEDPDVSFACAMIPHHTAAISMAEVELEYGDSDEMKEMAQKIIDAQKAEIAELTAWIEEQAQ